MTGKLSDFYSIRINNQWGIIFLWADANASEVAVMDLCGWAAQVLTFLSICAPINGIRGARKYPVKLAKRIGIK